MVDDSAQVVSWLPPELPDVVAAPHDHDMTTLLEADAALAAVEGAAKDMRKDVRVVIDGHAEASRQALGRGAEFRVRSPNSQAYDSFHAAQVVISEHERLAGWLAEHHPAEHEACVLVFERYEVDGPAFEKMRAVLRDDAGSGAVAYEARELRKLVAYLDDIVRVVVETTVDPVPLEDAFHAVDGRLVDDDGQVLPGVVVTPRRLRGTTVKPDGKHVAGLKALVRSAVTRRNGDDQ